MEPPIQTRVHRIYQKLLETTRSNPSPVHIYTRINHYRYVIGWNRPHVSDGSGRPGHERGIGSTLYQHFFFLGNTIDLCYLPTDLVFLYLCAYQGGLEVCDLFKHLPRAGTVRWTLDHVEQEGRECRFAAPWWKLAESRFPPDVSLHQNGTWYRTLLSKGLNSKANYIFSMSYVLFKDLQ